MAVDSTNSLNSGTRGGQLTGLRGVWSGVVAHVAQTVTQVQIARMHGVLAGMSDHQLEQIGTSRDKLRRHAEWLITSTS